MRRCVAPHAVCVLVVALILVANSVWFCASAAASNDSPSEHAGAGGSVHHRHLDELVAQHFSPFIHEDTGWHVPVSPSTLDAMEVRAPEARCPRSSVLLPILRRSQVVYRHCHVRVRIVSRNVAFRYFSSDLESGFKRERAERVLHDLLDVARGGGGGVPPVDFFFSACDHPVSADNTFMGRRAGFVVFASHVAEGVSIDVPYPDPLDLSPAYFPPDVHAAAVPWEARRRVAVFRGSTTNFDLFDGNWYAAPRLQLARLSALWPDELDAGVTKVVKARACNHNDAAQRTYGCAAEWSGTCCVPGGASAVLASLNISLAASLDYAALARYKYVIEAEGGLGSSRTCGLFVKHGGVVMRQRSAFKQFFAPLLVSGRHFVEVDRHWGDLRAQLAWLHEHDDEAQRIAQRGAALMAPLCTRGVRLTYWAKLLRTYATLLTEPPRMPPAAEFTACPFGATNSSCPRTAWRLAADLPPPP